MAGDVHAATPANRVIMTRCRIGLEGPALGVEHGEAQHPGRPTVALTRAVLPILRSLCFSLLMIGSPFETLILNMGYGGAHGGGRGDQGGWPQTFVCATPPDEVIGVNRGRSLADGRCDADSDPVFARYRLGDHGYSVAAIRLA